MGALTAGFGYCARILTTQTVLQFPLRYSCHSSTLSIKTGSITPLIGSLERHTKHGLGTRFHLLYPLPYHICIHEVWSQQLSVLGRDSSELSPVASLIVSGTSTVLHLEFPAKSNSTDPHIVTLKEDAILSMWCMTSISVIKYEGRLHQ